MELYLIRHTTPDVKAGICYGQSDIDVAATFAEEAASIQQKLASINPTAVYTSPSRRCSRLAQVLADYWGSQPPIEDSRLMELHFGEWEMQSWDDIDLSALECWSVSYIQQPPPGGETFTQLHQRARDILGELKATSELTSAAVITHAGVIRALLAEAMDLPLSETFKFELSYGGMTQLACNEEAMQVACINA